MKIDFLTSPRPPEPSRPSSSIYISSLPATDVCEGIDGEPLQNGDFWNILKKRKIY